MTSAAGITCVSVSNTLRPFFILCLLCVFQRGSPSSRFGGDYSAEPDAHASLPQRAPREAIDAERSSRVEDQTRMAGTQIPMRHPSECARSLRAMAAYG